MGLYDVPLERKVEKKGLDHNIAKEENKGMCYKGQTAMFYNMCAHGHHPMRL